MAYLFNTEEDTRQMLATIGAGSIDDLFAGIPKGLRLGRDLSIPPAMSELELTQHIHSLSSQNLGVENGTCFLGGGAYDPISNRGKRGISIVDNLNGRGIFDDTFNVEVKW